MKEHLLQIDNFRFEQQNFQSSINLSIYKRELIAVCSPSFLDVDKLQENYKRHLLKGTLFFKSQPPQLLSKGKPLKYFYTISKYICDSEKFFSESFLHSQICQDRSGRFAKGI